MPFLNAPNKRDCLGKLASGYADHIITDVRPGNNVREQPVCFTSDKSDIQKERELLKVRN